MGVGRLAVGQWVGMEVSFYYCVRVYTEGGGCTVRVRTLGVTGLCLWIMDWWLD